MDTLVLVGRLLLSLAVVLGVMWLIARRMRRGVRGKDSRLIDVIGRQQLSRTASVVVVRVMDQALVIGVTDSQVRVLGETDLAAAQALLASNATPASPRRTRNSRTARTARSTRPGRTGTASAPLAVADAAATERPRAGLLAGSALSAHTWKQTLESLRDLTTRSS